MIGINQLRLTSAQPASLTSSLERMLLLMLPLSGALLMRIKSNARGDAGRYVV